MQGCNIVRDMVVYFVAGACSWGGDEGVISSPPH